MTRPRGKDVGSPSGLEKAGDRLFLLNPWNAVLLTPRFDPLDPFQTPDLQNCESIKLGCFKPLNVW